MKKKFLLGALASSLFILPCLAQEKGDIIVRVGYTAVEPNDSSSTLRANSTSLANSGVGIDSNAQLGLTVTYMMSSNWGLEILAATPFSHTLNAQGTTLANLGLSSAIGEVEHLPPTLSLQHYFNNSSRLTPYLGVGLNYTMILDESLNQTASGILGTTEISVDDSVGITFEVGADFNLNENWLFNLSIWHMDISTTADITNSGLGNLQVDLDIDPWVYSLGFGYRF